MLLEEALAGNTPSNSSASASSSQQLQESQRLSPHETALALLSFLRDELPAGGAVAERRFVNLYPLIVDKVFGEWNVETPRGGSPLSSPLVASPSSPSLSGSSGRDYRHADGGWLSLYLPPPTSSSNSGRSVTKSSSPLSTSSVSLEQDPIVRLLRAPAPPPPSSRGTGTTSTSNSNGNNNYYYAPLTLLDAISAESIHRPNVKFKFPLGALSELSMPLVENWKVCYWNEMQTKDDNQGGVAGTTGTTTVGTTTTTTTTVRGNIGKENATRLLALLVHQSQGGSGSMKNNGQVELSRHFQQLYQQQHQPSAQQQQQQHGGGRVGRGGGSISPPPLSLSTSSTTPSKSRMLSSSTPATSSTGYRTPSQKGGGTAATNEPNLKLTMLEYYLFLFVRFPLSNPTWLTQMQDQQRRFGGRSTTTSNNNAMYGQRIYSHLFTNYMNSYLSLGQEYNEDSLDVGMNCFDGATTTTMVTSSYTSELFLRLIIELWIEGPNVATTTQDAVLRYRRVRAGVWSSGSTSLSPSSSSSSSTVNPTLRDSLELAQPSNNAPVVPPPGRVQSGILSLVRHLLSDLSMREMVRKVSGVVQQRQREDRSGSTSGGGDRPSTPTLVNDDNIDGSPPSSGGRNKVAWPLPPAITAMQQSTFNYIRLGLACGAIHDRSSNFHWALETWLMWLEPWNYVVKRRAVVPNRQGSISGSDQPRGTAGALLRNAAATVTSHHRTEYYPSLVQPKPTSPSMYSAQWESYIVCNAHYYTVPLAIFLKRARELDFSSSVEYPRSLALVQRVLRVYSTGVVNVLNNVLNARRSDELTTSLFIRHGQNMGAYCPLPIWKLMDCQLDGTNLLEEVYGQHQKRLAGMDMLDRLEAKFNALFEGKIGNEEAALENLLTHVRYLVHLPLDYRVLVDEPARGFSLRRLFGLGAKDTATTAASDNVQFPDRGSDGKLTDLGRQQLYAGLCKCNPLDVHYIGDPMLSRVKSYEIPILVELTIRLSNYLNRKLGLVVSSSAPDSGSANVGDSGVMKRYREMEQYQKVKFRFNLRFLADSRNVIFASIVWWLVSTIRGFFSN